MKATADGELIRLKDVAQVEVGSEFVDIYSNKDGFPAVSMVLKQSPSSNANETIKSVKAKLELVGKGQPWLRVEGMRT
ncbi:MAG: efflux RND transporter permease subunit [Bacteroidota bacterium]